MLKWAVITGSPLLTIMKTQKLLLSENIPQTCTYSKTGFTMIELVIVIAIIGILAAVAVPKFFDMKSVAQEANKDKIIGIIRSGLSSYSSDQLAQNNQKVFPATIDLRLEAILDEVPDGWSYTPASGTLTFSEDNSTWLYTSPVSGNASKYTLIAQ